MSDRRYRDDEVRKIFGLATTQAVSKPAPSADANGLTLAQLQSIGLEAGLDPDAVARAAATLDTSGQHPVRTSFGMPIEVAHTVSLHRALTDHEWEQLVAELRATFRAKGKIATHGALKEWSNGNLHAWVEPDATGYRLRMGTIKGDAATFNALGVTGIVASAVSFASLVFWGAPTSIADTALYLGPLLLGGGGFSALAANRARLPRWARQRQDQMRHIAARVRAMMGGNVDES